MCKRFMCIGQGTVIPPSVVLGVGQLSGVMEGSHTAPDIRTQWEAPQASASGTAHLSPTATRLSCKAPALNVSGVLYTTPPSADLVKLAVTQVTVLAPSWLPPSDGVKCDVVSDQGVHHHVLAPFKLANMTFRSLIAHNAVIRCDCW